MRHLLIGLCTTGAACGIVSQASASSLEFTLDLMAPCTANTCTGTHPTDAGFQIPSNSFSYAVGSGSPSNYVATLGVTSPLVCDEISSTGTTGANTSSRIAPSFFNAAPGDLLEFNSGGPSIVDLGSLTFDGGIPAGVTTSYSNYGSPSLPPQVMCYQINQVSGGPTSYALGPYGIFRGAFEDHPAGEPWVSLQTVSSPSTGGSGPVGPKGPVTTNTMAYVVQIHNASSSANWRLSLGYDKAFFDPANSGTAPWACVLGAGIPQPGSTNGTCTTIGLPYKLQAGDVQAATDSIYIYVDYTGSTAATSAWSTLAGTFYPAAAAVFPPFGTYPQRFDDKVAVASGNNLPTLNIGNIVCTNDKSSTACTLYSPDGNAVPTQVKYHNSIDSNGLVNVDPLLYYVNPVGGNTLPSAVDTLSTGSVSNVSCNDPKQILANPLAAGSFTTSNGAAGALQLAFTFAPSGSLYVAGTAACTATFTASAHAPTLSVTRSFTITMLPTTTSHFAVTAPANITAGSAFNSLTVTALDSANNTVSTYSGTVHFSSSDGFASLPANATLSGGIGTFSATLKTAGSETISVSDTVTPSLTGTSNSVAVSPASASHLAVNTPSTATVGAPFGISVTALDPYNNTDTNYGGMVHFTSTDGSATLPADMTLTFGVGTPNVTFNAMGMWTLTATDTVTPAITGTSNSITAN
jgi:hypothetical protein